MAKIACFGCSWTHGSTFEIGVSWVNELARMMPEHEFFNLSQAGSSAMHSIWVMEQFEKYQKPDFTIFQITNEGRMTYYLDEQLSNPDYLFGKKFMRPHDDIGNLKTLCLQPDVVQSVNYGTLFRENACPGDPHYEHRYNFATIFYKMFDRPKTFDLEHKILSTYIKNNVNLAFFHTLDSMPPSFGFDDTACIEHAVGKEQFMLYSSDGRGFHFTEEGCRWQAAYIKSLIENKL